MTNFRPSLLAALLAALPTEYVFAQQPPDAGQLLQQQQQQQIPAVPRAAPGLNLQAPETPAAAPSGAQVTLSRISIGGATLFSETELLAVLGDFAGKPYRLADLNALAARITAHYATAGYPFTRAIVPAQTITDGLLRLEVIEGRYGRVQAVGDADLLDATGKYLSPLQPGAPIHAKTLERIALLLGDLPGISATPGIYPGSEPGKGNVEMRVTRSQAFTGDIGLDNHGSSFTGEHRVRANGQWDSPFTLGDQLVGSIIYSEENLWLGSLGYSLPLGSSGLRGNVGYAQTYYKLAKDFANLKATGTAKVSTLALTYPIIRSQNTNLKVAATYQHKRLNDKQELAGTDDSKSSDSLPIALNFDHRDGLWGGGISYGSLSYTAGRLNLGSVLENTDRTSGQNTRGSFDKWNLDIARVQSTPVSNLNLFGRISAQKAGKNMDSSEDFSLGGATRVRAYPTGEGGGDEGWSLQLEVRYTMGQYSPYVFHDSGRVTLNANNGNLTTPANPNHRSIGGEGLGLRYNEGNWNLDANLSWRSHGGQPLSDTADRNPRVWISAGYKF